MLSSRGSLASRTLCALVALAVASGLVAVGGAVAAPPTFIPGPTPPSTAVPGAWLNTSGERFDGDIPGRILHISPTAGSLSALSDKADVFRVDLAEGQRAYFKAITTGGSLDVRLRLYAPGSTSIAVADPLLAIPDIGGGGRLIYEAPAGQGGIYYLEVYAYTGFGEYRLFGPEENDSIPGTALDPPEAGLWDVAETGAANGDTLDVYRTHLTLGEVYEFNVTNYANDGDFEFALYPPNTVDPVGDGAVATSSGSRSKSLRYTATWTGDYYIAVKWTDGTGQYRLNSPGSPFGQWAHGFPFGNFGGQADEDLFRSVFGLPSGPLTLGARMFYEGTFKGAYGGGQCYGIAVVAGMFYRDVYGADPGDFEPGAQYARDIPRKTSSNHLDEPIERYISKYHYYQKDPTIRESTVWFDPDQAFSRWLDLVVAFGGGWQDPYFFGFRGERPNGTTWGHATNITGLRWARPDGQVYMSMYDSNAPNDMRHFATDGTDFDVGGYNDVYLGVMRPISPNELDSIPKLWGEVSLVGVSFVRQFDVAVMHTDSLGRRLGQLDGEEIAEIPGGERIELFTGIVDSDWREPVEYYLPSGEDYRVDIRRASAGEVTYDLFDGDQAMRVQVPETGPDATWRVETNLGGHGLRVSAMSPMPQQAAVKLAREPGDVSRMLEVSGLALGGRSGDFGGVFGAPSGLEMASSERADSFDVRLTGESQTCDLTLSGLVGRKTLSTRIEDFVPSVGITHTVEVLDWRQLPRTPIFIVGHLPDGTDDVIAYQVTRENFGSMVAEMKAQGLIGKQLAAAIVSLRAHSDSAGPLRKTLDSAVVAGQVSRSTADRILAAAEALGE